MNQVELAIDDTVHDFKGGTNVLAKEMGMSRTILNNKACHTNEFHHFQPLQLLQLQRITGNWSITNAYVAEHKAWLVEQGQEEKPGDLFKAILEASHMQGELCQCIKNALEDDNLTERERRECIKAADEAIAKFEALKQSIHSHENKLKAV